MLEKHALKLHREMGTRAGVPPRRAWFHRPISSRRSSGSQELPEGSVGVVVPVQYVEIVRSLSRAALAGDVSAARELRAWKAEHPEVDEHVDLAQQPAVIRDRLLRRLIAEEQAILDADAGGAGSSNSGGP